MTITGRIKQYLGLTDRTPKLAYAFAAMGGGGPVGPAQNGGVAFSGNLAEDPLRTASRNDLMAVISHLRNGDRPSLVGQIPGLTPKMEAAFRTSQYLMRKTEFQGNEVYQLLHPIGGETSIGSSWSDLGFAGNPDQSEKVKAHEAFTAWEKTETRFEAGNLGSAKESFRKEITDRYGITLLNASSAGEVYYVMEMLKLLPENFLSSGALKSLNLKGKRVDASRFGRYDKGEIDIINPYSNWDKYLLTVVLIHELGHAVFASLTAEQKRSAESLYKKFWAAGAVFGTDFWGMPAEARITEQSEVKEFFAENLMHYIILGKSGMTGYKTNLPLIGELYEFYRNLVVPVNI